MPTPSETWQNDWQTGFSSWPSIPANRPPPPQRSVLLTSSFRRAPAAVAFALPSTRFQLRKTSAPPTFQFSQTRCKSETSAPLQQVPRNQHHVILPHATLRNRWTFGLAVGHFGFESGILCEVPSRKYTCVQELTRI